MGGLCVAVAGLAAAALSHDLAIGKTPWGSGACLATMAFALGWVIRDYPREYRLEGSMLVVQGWTGSRGFRVHACHLATGAWKEGLAINGGFGWYGAFRLDDRAVRAFVTHLDYRVIVETGDQAVVISPADPLAFVAAATGAG